jgi:lipopolysaccharide transport system ATP-binding protein
MRVRMRYETSEPVIKPNFTVAFLRSDDVACCNYNTSMDGVDTGTVSGSGVIELEVPALKLVSELYTIQILVWDAKFRHLYCAQNGKSFQVRDPVLSTDFGVFHEPGAWSLSPDAARVGRTDRSFQAVHV